jgi:hypothetical protein
MTLQAELLKLWPDATEVRACIKGDAEMASPEVLLAVHQEMDLRRRDVGSQAPGTNCSEEQVLQALMAPSGDGRVIVPVVGTSGVGKSHIVRWLYARLRNFPNASDLVVINIPRNTSLKGVLTILLMHESLKGARYETYRRGLAKAQEELDPQKAAHLLCEMLAQESEKAAEAAQQALAHGKSDPLLKLQASYGQSNFLPSLLRHPVVRDRHWLSSPSGAHGPVRQLVEQLVTSGEREDDDKRKLSFTPEDLSIEDLGEGEVGRAAAKALGYLRRVETREAVAKVLNSVIDSAKGSILHMDPTVGTMFEAIRAGLLGEKRELVLLVEDFATTSGLQAQLVQAMLKEGVRDGTQVLCTMRTAVAYTPGSFDPPDTFKTRAAVEWYVIDDAWTPAEVNHRARNLVGAYLNAARVGIDKIKRAAANAESLADRAWIPTFGRLDDAAELVSQAFGTTDLGYPLFPFNAAAIEQLLKEGKLRDGKVVYNPRYIINNILRKVLDWRKAFESNHFPPLEIASSLLKPAQEEKLESFISAKGWEKEYPRYRVAIGYWLSDAESFAAARAGATTLLLAFGLPWEKGAAPSLPQRAPPSPLVGAPPLPTPAAEVPKWKKDLESRMRELENWKTETELSQDTSRALRMLLFKALQEAEPPDWFLLRRRVPDRWAQEIRIPRSFGADLGKEDEAATAVCSDADYARPENRAAIAAALGSFFRFEAHGRSWNYDGAEDDLPRYCALVSRMLPRFRKYSAERPLDAKWDPLPTIVSGLLLSARGLGVERGNSARKEDLIASLFEFPLVPAAEDKIPSSEPSAWSTLQETFRALRSAADAPASTSWRALLIDLVGARQGTGKAIHALDIARLKPALEAALAEGAFVKPLVLRSEVGPAGERIFELMQPLAKLAKTLDEEATRVEKWRIQALSTFGTPLNGPAKDALAESLRKVIERAQIAGFCTAQKAQSLGDLVTKFQKTQAVDAMDSAARLAQATNPMDCLRELGRPHEVTRRVLEEIAGNFSQYFVDIEDRLIVAQGLLGPDPMGQAVADMKAELGAWSAVLKEDA